MGKNRLVELDEASFKEFKSALRDLPAEYKKAIRRVHKNKAEQIASVAAGFAPRGETGRLQRSVRGGATLNSGQIKAGTARVPYAPPLHWGWPSRHIRPRRFIVWALAKVARDSNGSFEQEYLDEIAKVFKDRLRDVDIK